MVIHVFNNLAIVPNYDKCCMCRYHREDNELDPQLRYIYSSNLINEIGLDWWSIPLYDKINIMLN